MRKVEYHTLKQLLRVKTLKAFISIYAPSQFDPNFLPALTTTLLCIQDCFFFIIGADMNAVVDVSLDRSCVQNYPTHSLLHDGLCKFTSDFSLIDVYRIFHPTKRQYTFYSASHKSYSRLDYIISCFIFRNT